MKTVENGSSLSRTMGEGNMEFIDRLLKCCDCGNDFVFTAGEQLFFFDKQFKNDPKRCKLCKAKRAGLGRSASAAPGVAALPLSRTETRTSCSACGIETTVPFKPTQGRPVLCRSCFQLKRVPTGVAAVAALDSPAEQVAALEEAAMPTIAAATTMEMIAESSMPLGSETPSPELVGIAAEAAQA